MGTRSQFLLQAPGAVAGFYLLQLVMRGRDGLLLEGSFVHLRFSVGRLMARTRSKCASSVSAGTFSSNESIAALALIKAESTTSSVARYQACFYI